MSSSAVYYSHTSKVVERIARGSPAGTNYTLGQALTHSRHSLKDRDFENQGTGNAGLLILFTSRMVSSIALFTFASQPLCREEGPHFARPFVLWGENNGTSYRASGGNRIHRTFTGRLLSSKEVSSNNPERSASLFKKIAIPFKRFTHSKQVELSKEI